MQSFSASLKQSRSERDCQVRANNSQQVLRDERAAVRRQIQKAAVVTRQNFALCLYSKEQ